MVSSNDQQHRDRSAGASEGIRSGIVFSELDGAKTARNPFAMNLPASSTHQGPDEIRLTHYFNGSAVAALAVVVLFLSSSTVFPACGQQSNDLALGNKAIGEIRIDLRPGSGAAKSREVESVLLTTFGITHAPKDFRYTEKMNVAGGIQLPLIIAASSDQAPKQWLDLVVPFGTEEMWTTRFAQLDIAAKAYRKQASADRSEYPEDFGVSGESIAAITAPTFTLKIADGVTDKLWATLRTLLKEAYPAAVVSPLLPTGTTVVLNELGFAVDRAGPVLRELPKWQKFQIQASREGKEGDWTLRLTFLGFYAEGLGPIEPPVINYKSMLLSDYRSPAKPFAAHASKVAAMIAQRLPDLLRAP